MTVDGVDSQAVSGGLKIAGPSPPIENRRCVMAFGSAYDYLLRTIGFPVIYDQVLVGNNATVNQNLFAITGVNQIFEIYGIVTTQLGNNVTAVHLVVRDGTISREITLAAGTIMNAAPVGSLISKKEIASVAINFESSLTGIYEEGILVGAQQPFIAGKKATANTFIRMIYTTSDTPTSGVIRWKLAYKPLSDDGVILAV